MEIIIKILLCVFIGVLVLYALVSETKIFHKKEKKFQLITYRIGQCSEENYKNYILICVRLMRREGNTPYQDTLIEQLKGEVESKRLDPVRINKLIVEINKFIK